MLTFLKKHAAAITISGLAFSASIIATGVFIVPLSSLVFTGLVIVGSVAVTAGVVLYWTNADDKHNMTEENAKNDETTQAGKMHAARKAIVTTSSEDTCPVSSEETIAVIDRIAALEINQATLAQQHEELKQQLLIAQERQRISDLATKKTMDTFMSSVNGIKNASNSLQSSSSSNNFFNAANSRTNDENFDPDEDQQQTKKL